MKLFKKKKVHKKVTAPSKTILVSDENTILSYQAANLQMQGSRDRQEDSFALVNVLDVTKMKKEGLFAMIADGMGGMNDGKLVSELAVAEFVKEFRNMDRQKDIPEQLYESIHRINRLLFEKFKGDGGTTAVIVMIYNAQAYWASVGDSAVFLKRKEGLFKLNCDHTYHNKLYLEEIYKEDIDKKRADCHADKARLSEFMGNSEIDHVDYNRRPLQLQTEDVIFLCSDGISSFIDRSEIEKALEASPPVACSYLEDLIKQKNYSKQDNYTGLVIAVR